MDFWDLTKMMVRRWYIAAPLLLVTGAGVLYANNTVDPDYTTTSYVQMVPPTTRAPVNDAAPTSRNPWLDLGLNSLSTAAVLITLDQNFLTEMSKSGFSDGISMTQGNNAPICTVQVIGSSPQQASQTTDRVIERFTQVIERLQSDYGVKPENMIMTRRLDEGDNITISDAGVKRAVVTIGGIGVLFSAAFSIAFDAMMSWRGRRRREREQVMAQPNSSVPVSPSPMIGYGSASHQTQVIRNPDEDGPASHGRTPGVFGRPQPASSEFPAAPGEGHDLTDEFSGGSEASVERPVPVDATIVLPLTFPAGRNDKGGKRR